MPDYPLSPHTMSHVMSDIHDWMESRGPEEGPIDQTDILALLQDGGWGDVHSNGILDQVWEAYLDTVVQCSTCGKPATHMWGSVGEDGQITSMAGVNVLAPSCDDCGGNKYDDCNGRPVVRGPIGITSVKPARTERDEIVDAIKGALDEFDSARLDSHEFEVQINRPPVDRVADALSALDSLLLEHDRLKRAPVPTHEQLVNVIREEPEKFDGAIRDAVKRDPGLARSSVATAMRALAEHLAHVTRSELISYTFDEVLLDLLFDARGGERS